MAFLSRSAAVALALVALAGCGDGAGAPPAADAPAEASRLVVYSGRNESLVGPLFERLEQRLGIEIRVRYGGTAELAATLMEEGEATPADLFLSQDAGALGALSEAGMLAPLPAELLARVPPELRSPAGDWIGLSGRVRCVVYNTTAVRPADLPQALEEVTAPRYRGRFGIAPTNASFQAHMAVHRAVAGAEANDRLLAGLAANRPARYPKNSAIVEAVAAGEIDWGLVNHYYLLRALSEVPKAPAANFFMPRGEVSSFVNLAGVAVVSPSPAATALVGELLSEASQAYFAEETFEYPLVAGVPAAASLPPLAELRARPVPFERVAGVLDETLAAIDASGLLR